MTEAEWLSVPTILTKVDFTLGSLASKRKLRLFHVPPARRIGIY